MKPPAATGISRNAAAHLRCAANASQPPSRHSFRPGVPDGLEIRAFRDRRRSERDAASRAESGVLWPRSVLLKVIRPKSVIEIGGSGSDLLSLYGPKSPSLQLPFPTSEQRDLSAIARQPGDREFVTANHEIDVDSA